MEETVRNKLLKLNSTRLIHELETFAWVNGKPQASPGYNDDLILALCIGCWVIDVALQVNKRDLEYNQIMLSSIYRVESKVGSKIKGQVGYSRKVDVDPLESELKNCPWVQSPAIYIK